MLFHSIGVHNPIGAVDPMLTLDIDGSGSYIIHEIEGLGPPKNDVHIDQTGFTDGGEFTKSATTPRNIVMKLGYKPDFTVGQSVGALRRALYKAFPLKGTVRLRFTGWNIEVSDIIGVVEAIEPVIFTKDPVIQISLVCKDPYFVWSGTNLTLGPITVFPRTVFNTGDVPVGFKCEILKSSALAGTHSFNITTYSEQGFEKSNNIQNLVLSGFTMALNDRIYINTIPGERDLYMIRASDGVRINMFKYWTPQALWPTFWPDETFFSVTGTLTASWDIRNLSYSRKWRGL